MYTKSDFDSIEDYNEFQEKVTQAMPERQISTFREDIRQALFETKSRVLRNVQKAPTDNVKDAQKTISENHQRKEKTIQNATIQLTLKEKLKALTHGKTVAQAQMSANNNDRNSSPKPFNRETYLKIQALRGSRAHS